MIRIGLNNQEKFNEIDKYLEQNNIKKIFIFYPEKFPLLMSLPLSTEYIEYNDIIMYKFFYRLLEEIDKDVLLIFNECLRTQNRSDLTYNCAHHYCGQTNHKIIFEQFPFIDSSDDFMILLDLQNKGKYKGKSFDYQFLKNEDIKVKSLDYILQTIDLCLNGNDIVKYETKKKQLFDNLGNADPDTIPRQLHVFVGNLKKPFIESDKLYVARNERFKMPNINTYKDINNFGNYIIIDFPHRRIDFNDFLKFSSMTNILFINSGLKVDLYYINEFNSWVERLGDFYAHANISN